MIVSSELKKRDPAAPDIDREFAIKKAMALLKLSGARIAIKTSVDPAMITETIRGKYASARIRSLIAAEIRTACADQGRTITDVGLTLSDLWEE
jgi:hypothetical protein